MASCATQIGGLMKIYTIDNDGFIVEVKNVGDKYIKNPNDFEGEAPFAINHHH